MDELRDIKPLLEIPDGSYYLFLTLVFLGIALLLAIIGFGLQRYWKNKKVDMQIVYLFNFKNLDWSDVKDSAYEATKLGRILTQNNERAREIYEQLVPMLEEYKYKKEVSSVDEKTLKQYNLLVHIIDESL